MFGRPFSDETLLDELASHIYIGSKEKCKQTHSVDVAAWPLPGAIK